jgi:methylglyoxal synthase
MKSGERLALAVILGLCVLAGGTAGATAYAWRRAGSVRIAVHESGPGGNDFSMQLPGLLVNAAIAVMPFPEDDELNARLHEIAPVLRAVSGRLATLPDVVLVDVKSDSGTVRVEKLGPDLVIRVVSLDERVEIAVPVESVRRLMRKLESEAAA